MNIQEKQWKKLVKYAKKFYDGDLDNFEFIKNNEGNLDLSFVNSHLYLLEKNFIEDSTFEGVLPSSIVFAIDQLNSVGSFSKKIVRNTKKPMEFEIECYLVDFDVFRVTWKAACGLNCHNKNAKYFVELVKGKKEAETSLLSSEQMSLWVKKLKKNSKNFLPETIKNSSDEVLVTLDQKKLLKVFSVLGAKKDTTILIVGSSDPVQFSQGNLTVGLMPVRG